MQTDILIYFVASIYTERFMGFPTKDDNLEHYKVSILVSSQIINLFQKCQLILKQLFRIYTFVRSPSKYNDPL